MTEFTPVKLNNRTYVCATCKREAECFEVRTNRGNAARKCWTCLNDKERAAYSAAHAKCSCGSEFKLTARNFKLCAACEKPPSLCKCAKH